jgi:ribonuclease P protein subunit RPR2
MAQRGRAKKPEYQLGIAKDRINILLKLAKKESKANPERSRRYALLARKIGMRYNVRLPVEWKRVFCKGCGTLLKPGVTCEQRKEEGATIIRCGKCNRIYRYPAHGKGD